VREWHNNIIENRINWRLMQAFFKNLWKD